MKLRRILHKLARWWRAVRHPVATYSLPRPPLVIGPVGWSVQALNKWGISTLAPTRAPFTGPTLEALRLEYGPGVEDRCLYVYDFRAGRRGCAVAFRVFNPAGYNVGTLAVRPGVIAGDGGACFIFLPAAEVRP